MDKIIVDSVDFAYQTDLVLKNVSFSVPAGSFVGIVGPNGGGKTTLLKLLMGFLMPNKGQIQIFNQDPLTMQKNVGYVPQANNLDKDFPITVYELVLMGNLSEASFFKGYPEKVKQKANEVIDRLGLNEHKNQAFGHLSGGLAKRALIARALVSNPELLFLDEPIANVDQSAKDSILKIVQTLKNKMTIFMITHDLKAVVEIADLVLCVETNISQYEPKDVCEHFRVGLYHPPRSET